MQAAACHFCCLDSYPENSGYSYYYTILLFRLSMACMPVPSIIYTASSPRCHLHDIPALLHAISKFLFSACTGSLHLKLII